MSAHWGPDVDELIDRNVESAPALTPAQVAILQGLLRPARRDAA